MPYQFFLLHFFYCCIRIFTVIFLLRISFLQQFFSFTAVSVFTSVFSFTAVSVFTSVFSFTAESFFTSFFLLLLYQFLLQFFSFSADFFKQFFSFTAASVFFYCNFCLCNQTEISQLNFLQCQVLSSECFYNCILLVAA